MYKARMYKAAALALALGAGGLVAGVPDGLGRGAWRQGAGCQVGGRSPADQRPHLPQADVHQRHFAGRRVGFYSYSYRDVMGRYRDPYLDRQTQAGPFDYGFFFNSGITPRGGDSPYMR